MATTKAAKKTTTKKTTAKKASAKKASSVGKKSGASKKGAGLSVIEGGKAKSEREAPILKDGKTPANPDAMRRALAVYGEAPPPNATPAQLLALVRKHLGGILKGLDDEEKVRCSTKCREVSTNHTDFCPFCGDEGEDPEEAEAEEAAAPPAETSAIEATKEGGLAALEAKLNECVGRINKLRTDLAVNSYDLGVELRVIHEEELWKARGHESFKDFIQKDLEISRSMAYRLMDITKQFDRETFEQVGSRKLALIAGIQDSEAREQALESARAGASTRDVERQVNESRGKASPPDKEKGGSATPPKKKGNEITLLAKVGSKAQLVGFRSATSGRPIKQHKDDAYAEFALSEDVMQRIALKKDKEGNVVGVTVAFIRAE